MIKTVAFPANLDWAVGLAVLFVIILFSLLRSHARGFRLKIFALVADAAGIVYFMLGKYMAVGAVILGFIFWSWTSVGVTRRKTQR